MKINDRGQCFINFPAIILTRYVILCQELLLLGDLHLGQCTYTQYTTIDKTDRFRKVNMPQDIKIKPIVSCHAVIRVDLL